jgi:glutamine amidotransferase
MGTIAIIDYGMGNIHSVKKALEVKGAKVRVTDSPAVIKNCDKLVLPGVGAFGDAMRELRRKGLVEAIKKHIAEGKIFLGICLGMHLLFESSQESPKVKGLGILKGKVRRFAYSPGYRVPHMGWNRVIFKKRESRLFRGIADKSYVYFCHSYYAAPVSPVCIAARTEYKIKFASIIEHNNVFAMQFHPEKSQAAGLCLINNFVKL